MNDIDSQNQQNYYTLHRPNWEFWKSKRQARLWEAVALVCDLDPFQFRFMDTAKLDTTFDRTNKLFKDILPIAKANLGSANLKIVEFSPDGIEESLIDLAKLGAWAISIRLTLPDGFPWKDEAFSPLTREWPWGSYETDLLRKLAEATNKFWKNYDPTDPTTAPTNQLVEDWLTGQGVAKRTAEVIATILRDDKLANGRRN